MRSEALDIFMDNRFTGRKHFWSACVVDRPKTKKKLAENTERYKEEGDFSDDEIIQFKAELTGVFPLHMVISENSIKQLAQRGVPPISEFDKELGMCWFVPRKIVVKKTKRGKTYWVVEVVDSNNEITKIRCWGIRPEKDHIHVNMPYMAVLDYNDGFSTRAVGKSFRMIGVGK